MDKNQVKLHEAKRLSVDSSKALNTLSWIPVWNIDKAIYKTISWYQNWLENGRINTYEDLDSYIEDASNTDMKWANNEY